MKYLITAIGIVSIAWLEGLALANGVDGTVLTLAFCAICTIVGYIGGQKTTKL